MLAWLISNRPEDLETVIVTAGFADDTALAAATKSVHAAGLSARAVVTSLAEAQRCERAGFDGLVAKGSEAGGWVGEETAFVLAQHLRGNVGLPIWLQGGIGLHSAAAAFVAGVEGIVLSDQLLLAKESRVSEQMRGRLEALDGSQTEAIGGLVGAPFRCYFRQDSTAAARMRSVEASGSTRDAWRRAVIEETKRDHDPLWALGQDAAFAAALAKRFKTVGGIIAALETAMDEQTALAIEQQRTRPRLGAGPES